MGSANYRRNVSAKYTVKKRCTMDSVGVEWRGGDDRSNGV